MSDKLLAGAEFEVERHAEGAEGLDQRRFQMGLAADEEELRQQIQREFAQGFIKGGDLKLEVFGGRKSSADFSLLCTDHARDASWRIMRLFRKLHEGKK